MEERLLLHWKYTQKEWENFVKIEKENKKEDNIYMGVAIVILGTIVLMLARDTTLLMGLTFALPMGILIPFLRMKFSYGHLKTGVQHPEIQVFTNYMLVNKHKIALFGDKRHVKKISIVPTDNDLELLEFVVEWFARKGPTNDEFRIPIPLDSIEEARTFVKKYQK